MVNHEKIFHTLQFIMLRFCDMQIITRDGG